MLDRLRKQFLGVLTAAAVAVAFSLASPATADAQVSFGVQGDYGTEIEAVGIGPRIDVMIPGAAGFGLVGSFDYYFPDNSDFWEINANATYAFDAAPVVAPYIGAGLNYADVSPDGVDASNDETGLNVLGGLEFGVDAPVTPFVEGRYATTFDGQFVITGGILF